MAERRIAVVAPHKDAATGLHLARADGHLQRARIGDQTGGRIAFFLKSRGASIGEGASAFIAMPWSSAMLVGSLFGRIFYLRQAILTPRLRRASG